MAEGAATEAVVGKLVEYLMNALKEQVSYLCCYSCNVQRLADEVQELNVKYESVQQGVRAARANLEGNATVVDSWLTEVTSVQRESDMIRNAAREVRGKCLCKWLPVMHYCLSRDVVKATETATKLLKDTPTVQMFFPPIPAEIDPVPATSETGFKYRDSIEEAIIDALKDKRVYLIGIWGTGGVGKTTMAKKIEERVLRAQKSMFDHAVMAAVSQQPDLQKIQRQIASALGLQLNENDSLFYGARKLHNRLMDENSILIILDDVWRRLDLDELGIPSPSVHVGCKLLLTSRNQDAFTLPGDHVPKIFQLKILGPEESWALFKENAGIQDNSHDDLIPIAKDVAKECQGLPLALKTVGLALKTVRLASRDARKSYWDNALRELKQSKPINMPGVTEGVYKSLLYSINFLESEAKDLFLLCCLFPEDSDISLERLVGCRMALKGSESLMEARTKVETITRNLIYRSLLIESTDRWNNPCVKMHDVIRDVGIWIASEEKIESEGKIASEEKHVFMISHGTEEWPIKEEDSYRKYTCISLIFSGKRDIGIPECINCPRLEFLLLGALRDCPLNLPKTSFSRMVRLRYLRASNFRSLPSSVGLLNNLRTLHLKHCGIVETITEIGKLTHLEILCLIRCEFMVLPKEIGGLEKLRTLVIKFCESLKRIELGVISRLVQLEELVILNGSLVSDPVADITKDHLDELNSLNHLTTLKIEILNSSVIPTFTTLPPWVSKLKKYYIVVSPSSFDLFEFKKTIQRGRAIRVGDEALTPLGDWFYDMASDVDYLDVEGPSCMFFVKKLTQSKNRGNSVKHLRLSLFNDVQYLVEEDQQEDGATFPMLEYLSISHCDSFQEIFHVPPPAGSFEALEKIEFQCLPGLMRLWTLPTGKPCLSNIRRIYIDECQSLSYLFSLSVAQSLSQLEDLHVSNCPSMEHIFTKEDGGETGIHMLEFPKLYSLTIQHLKSLHDLGEGVNRIKVFKLRKLVLKDLPSIKGKGDPDIHQPSLFDHLQIAGNFDMLEILRVESINFKCLLPPSMLKGLSNLEELSLTNCSMVEEIIGNDENLGETALFPKLKRLSLSQIPKILTFCRAIEFPSLEQLKIEGCPLMERFSKGLSHASNSSLSFFNKEVCCPQLKRLHLKGLHNTTRIFDLPNFRVLTNLKTLHVSKCEKLEAVIVEEEVDGPTNIKEILSPQLEKLYLSGLPISKRLCHTKRSLELPSLKIVRIWDCPMLERFSLGTLHLPNITHIYMDGLRDADFVKKNFYNKEISSDQIHLEKDCFIISVKQMSIKGITDHKPYSSENFIDVVSTNYMLEEITGIVEITMLPPGVKYDVIFMIMLDEYAHGWLEGVEFKLELFRSGQSRVKTLSEQPRGRWIDLLGGDITRKHYQTNLEFSISQRDKESEKEGLSIKGVKFIKSLKY